MADLQKLITAYRSTRDMNVLGQIYHPFVQKVFRQCMHFLKNPHDSEDAVMDIFLEVKDKLVKYNVENFAPWLHTLARNHCLKKLRRKGSVLLTDTFSEEGRVEIEPALDQVDEYLGILPEAIDQLDERQRWCTVLFYLQGKSYKEIETLMGYSAMEVKSGVQNGKIKLKKLLEEHVNRSI